MAIFSSSTKSRINSSVVYSKPTELEKCKDYIRKDFPSWEILEFTDKVYDFLLIKTFEKKISRLLNPKSSSPVQREEIEKVQVVIAVTFVDDEETIDDQIENIFSETADWTFTHIITYNIRSILRELKELEENN
jgi:hypothetical protein